jgi:hypothetical protein
LDLTSLSPEIALLPEDSFDPLTLAVETLLVDCEMRLPLTFDTKRKRFMIGEISTTIEAALNTNVAQNIQSVHESEFVLFNHD